MKKIKNKIRNYIAILSKSICRINYCISKQITKHKHIDFIRTSNNAFHNAIHVFKLDFKFPHYLFSKNYLIYVLFFSY